MESGLKEQNIWPQYYKLIPYVSTSLSINSIFLYRPSQHSDWDRTISVITEYDLWLGRYNITPSDKFLSSPSHIEYNFQIQTLKILDIFDNNISPQGGKDLLDALQINTVSSILYFLINYLFHPDTHDIEI